METKVLFVCMGNICRSPSAVGVLRHLVYQAGLQESIKIDCAATHDYHVGEAPDGRAQFVSRKHGYDISDIRARQITPADIKEYDLILAMDWESLSYLQQMGVRQDHHKMMLLMRYANDYEEATVPDPYYGGVDGFFKMLDYLEDACQGLFEVLSKRVTQYQVA
ncbi:low molecular weight protein-tyrosine-phosphatase [Pelistega suis]|uniref:protein-tyrosine-phosphatase n=1 Tax=Pelistega suis TaxID=1631957 RepID=A0A849P7D4_9BURK|nr:low molecular weight protein-tyrosine-phosphatase [Pelistega suis]NOL51692.1 low molecular weight phosphotyrosine protein phosphatase [Pelistega suis]